jgi:hypothetical protein
MLKEKAEKWGGTSDPNTRRVEHLLLGQRII